MSFGLSPLSSSSPSSQAAEGSETRSAPIGIASVQSRMVSCTPCCVIESLWSAVYNLAACVWAGILGLFCREQSIAPQSSREDLEPLRSASGNLSLHVSDLFRNVSELNDRLIWAIMVRALSAELNEGNARFLEENLSPDALQRICGEHSRTFGKRIEIDQLDQNYAELALEPEGALFKQLDIELAGNVGVFIAGERYRSSRKILEALLQQGVERQEGLKILASLTHKGCLQASFLVTKLFTKMDGEESQRRRAILALSEIPIRAEVKFENSALKEVEICSAFQIIHMPFQQNLFTISTVTRIDGATGHAVITGVTS